VEHAELALDVVVPVHNEARSIDDTLRSVAATLAPLGRYRLIVVEDGSADGTLDVLRTLAQELPIILDSSAERRGYSRAMRSALARCSAQWVLCIDGDGQYDPLDIPELWRHRDAAAVVSGWRVRRAEGLIRRIGSAVLRVLFRAAIAAPVRDPSSSLVLMRGSVAGTLLPQLGHLPEAFWWEARATAARLGFSWLEVPVNHRVRAAGTTQVYTARQLPGVVWRQAAGLARLLLSRD
jgi:dolichol-phosphate mannosyltransferase